MGRRLTALLALAPALAACSSPPAPAEKRPHVLLVSLDTLRADAVGATDSAGASVTPHLDALATDSWTFEEAVTELPFTLTAHMTMLTGTAPDVHGVFREEDRLGAGLATLAETLGAAGYRTGAVVTSDWLRPAFGFGRGFQRYEEIRGDLEVHPRVHDAAWRMFDDLAAGGDPVFLWVHYYDAHSDFGARGNRRPYWAPPEQTRRLPEACRRDFCAPDPDGRCATGFLLWASHHPDQVSPEARDCLHRAYLAGVAALDEGVGRFLEAFSERGLGETSLLVVTSDHGEEFGEHGQFIHAQPFGETVRVPLIVRRPEGFGAGTRVAGRAQLADLMPTILVEVGLEVPTSVTGRALLAGGEPPEVALAQNKYRPRRYTWAEGPWKLLHDYESGEIRLYDLAADPGETLDVAASRPEITAALIERLDGRLRELRRHREALGLETEPGAQLPEEAKRRLEALGYVD